jgi:glycerate 2-kinase
VHILIAPNAFKNSVTAAAAAKAIEQGLLQSQLDCSTECFPIADGGDGTAALLVERLGAVRVIVTVSDPLGRPVQSSLGFVKESNTAIIGMSDASGLHMLAPAERNPLIASSRGTGELITAALDEGASNIIIGMGGSAAVDGGAGILHALGVQFFDAASNALEPLPRDLTVLDHISTSGLDKRVANVSITVLCDVRNPLLGTNGAAHVFGPQKGASAANVESLDKILAKLNEVVLQHTSVDMNQLRFSGTAGGAAAALGAVLGAQLLEGGEYFLKISGFEEAIRRSNLVITGEGSIDEQTMDGKGPFCVAAFAKRYELPVIGFGGAVPLEPGDEMMKYFDALFAIGNTPSTFENAIQNTEQNLRRLAINVGNLLHSATLA